MKQEIICLMLLAVSVSIFSQQIDSLKLTTKDYLIKSKHQKVAAWVMIGSGLTLELVANQIPEGEITSDNF